MGAGDQAGVGLKDIACVIAPYPTPGELNKRAASEFYKPLLSNGWTQRLVRALRRLP